MRGTTVLLAVLLLAACGQASPGSPTSPGGGVADPSGPSSTRPGAVPPSGPMSAPAPIDGTAPALPAPSVVTPAPGARTRLVSWSRAGLSADGRTLLLDVQVGGAPCDAVTGVAVDETATGVAVRVHAGALASADCSGAVPAMLGTFRVEAALQRPLGDRPLTGSA